MLCTLRSSNPHVSFTYRERIEVCTIWRLLRVGAATTHPPANTPWRFKSRGKRVENSKSTSGSALLAVYSRREKTQIVIATFLRMPRSLVGFHHPQYILKPPRILLPRVGWVGGIRAHTPLHFGCGTKSRHFQCRTLCPNLAKKQALTHHAPKVSGVALALPLWQATAP